MGKQKSRIENIRILFKNREGFENAVTKEELLEATFPEKIELIFIENKTALQKWELQELWLKIKSYLNRMRKNTDTFIVGEYSGGEWYYYIVSKDKEVAKFNGMLENIVRGIKASQQRALIATENKKKLRLW